MSTASSSIDFDALVAERTDEPAWLAERRKRSWAAFEEARWPSNKDEEWMRTDIRLFKLDKFSPAPAAERPAGRRGVALQGRRPRRPRRERQRPGDRLAARRRDLAAKGVIFGGLGEAVKQHGETLQAVFDREVVSPTYDRFAMLNDACWTGGVVLYVPKNVCLEKPLHAISRLAGEAASD